VEEHHDNKGAVDHEVPENYDLEKGVIRVIHIGDLDSNACCGTHLKTTKDIGSCILLHSQNIRGTNCRLFFMCGDRVTAYATEAHDILRKAGAALSCQTEDIDYKIQRLTLQARENANRERAWAGQVAAYEAATLRRKLDSEKFAVLYKPDASMDFVKTVEKELGKLKPGDGTVILITGEGKQGGSIVISGDNVDVYAAKVKQIVNNVKGGGKGKWQGKVVSYEKGQLDSLTAMERLSI
jgi:misacylated tRNA(Ala) deacylase